MIHNCIREYSSTLYVGLARAVSPTNTNFRLTFLLTRLQEALYEDLSRVSKKVNRKFVLVGDTAHANPT